KDDPAGDVADRGGADREGGGPRMRQSELHEDAAQDGNGGDRHGHGEEELKAEERDRLQEPRVEPRRRAIPEREGNREREHTDEDDRSTVAAQMAMEFELEPDLEHQEDQADLGDAGEDRTGRRGKQLGHEARED